MLDCVPLVSETTANRLCNTSLPRAAADRAVLSFFMQYLMCSDGPSDKSRPRFMRSEGPAPGVVTKGRGFERDNDVYENRWMKWLDVRPAIDDEENCDEG